jgi:hypothetical protein
MPFTSNTLVIRDGAGYGQIRVYYEPEQDELATFASSLYEAITDARWSSASSETYYKQGLPDHLFLRIVHQGTLTAVHEAALHEAGFVRSPEGWTLPFSLSWEREPRLRPLQEALEQRIARGDPRSRHSQEERVAAYNMEVLREEMRRHLGLELDGTFESIKLVDAFLVEEESERPWEFRVFSPATLIACGDYAAEVAVRTQPEISWGGTESHPLAVRRINAPADSRATTTGTRSKAIKRCVNGPGDSLYSLLSIVVQMVRAGRM